MIKKTTKEYQVFLMGIVQSDEKFRYQFLSRLQSDCNYYLWYGGGSENKLWADNEKDHIEVIKEQVKMTG